VFLVRRRGFERLIRKMLNLPKRPAVAYFHVWTPRRLGFHFYESPENVIEMVPEYYGLPSISMRNAMYHVVANFTVPADWLWRTDINHANCLGHRCALNCTTSHRFSHIYDNVLLLEGNFPAEWLLISKLCLHLLGGAL